MMLMFFEHGDIGWSQRPNKGGNIEEPELGGRLVQRRFGDPQGRLGDDRAKR